MSILSAIVPLVGTAPAAIPDFNDASLATSERQVLTGCITSRTIAPSDISALKNGL